MPGLDNLFMKYLREAPDDPGDVPDANMGGSSDIEENDSPPDISEDDTPPDLSDDNIGDDDPPDIGDNIGDDEFDNINGSNNDNTDELSNADLGLDEKVSAIMNMNLYQRYLTLLNNIASQTAMIKNNSDILQTISPDALSIIDSLKKLDENIRLYLKNTFVNENYSKNLLFFNKCINLLKLLNDIFDKNINKGISSVN